jgi:hypothetical protein
VTDQPEAMDNQRLLDIAAHVVADQRRWLAARGDGPVAVVNRHRHELLAEVFRLRDQLAKSSEDFDSPGWSVT